MYQPTTKKQDPLITDPPVPQGPADYKVDPYSQDSPATGQPLNAQGLDSGQQQALQSSNPVGYSPTVTPAAQPAQKPAQSLTDNPIVNTVIDKGKDQAIKSGVDYVGNKLGFGGAASGGSTALPTIPGGVASSVNGGTIMADGTTAAAPSAWTAAPTTIGGKILPAIAAAKGGYDIYNATQNGGQGLRTGLTEGGAGIGQLIYGPVGGAIGAAGGNVLGYGLTNKGIKGDLALYAMLGPVGAAMAIARHFGIDPMDLMHKNVRQQQAEITQKELGASKDPTYQKYVQGMRGQFAAPPPDPKHPFGAGQFATWDEYKTAGLKAPDLTGVQGNIDTFGEAWAKYSEPQRVAITQGLIQAGLYNSSKGGVVITDPAAAMKIRDQVLANPKAAQEGQSLIQQYQTEQAQRAQAAQGGGQAPGINPNAIAAQTAAANAQMRSLSAQARNDQEKQLSNDNLMSMMQGAVTNSQNQAGTASNYANNFTPMIQQQLDAIKNRQPNGQ